MHPNNLRCPQRSPQKHPTVPHRTQRGAFCKNLWTFCLAATDSFAQSKTLSPIALKYIIFNIALDSSLIADSLEREIPIRILKDFLGRDTDTRHETRGFGAIFEQETRLTHRGQKDSLGVDFYNHARFEMQPRSHADLSRTLPTPPTPQPGGSLQPCNVPFIFFFISS